MDYGIKISEDGIDVRTAGVTQLVYSSKWSNFKIKEILTATITLTGASTSGTTTVSSPLTYSPIFFPFVKSSTIGDKYRPALMGGTINMPDDYNWTGSTVRYRPATNDFYITVSHAGSGTRVFTFKIVVFIDKFTGTGSSIASIRNYGLKVSKDNNDIESALDQNLSMSSKYSNLTIANANTALITNSGNITHGLRYIPIFLAFFNPTGDATAGDRYYDIPISGVFFGSSIHPEVWVDSTKMYFSSQEASHQYKFKYLIFNERLE